MAGVLITFALVCALSLLLGQALLRLLGEREWSWLSAPVGFSVLLIVCSLTIKLPAHAGASRVAVLVAALAAVAILVRGKVSLRPLRPAAPVALLALVAALVPFIVNGRMGPLGVRLNADLPAHLVLADALRVGGEALSSPFAGVGYPTGPHAVAATLTGLGTDVETAFTALLLAVPVLTVLTALTLLSGLSLGRRIAGALLVGLPYLGAAYLVQSSFKEPMLAFLVLGFALWLHTISTGGPVRARSALAAGAVLAGCLTLYSSTGLAWPAAVGGLWAVFELGARRQCPGLGLVRRVVPAVAFASVLPALVALPELPRLVRFSEGVDDVAEGVTTGGNIQAPIPGYEVFGIWLIEDFRASPNSFYAGMLSALALLVAVYAAWWWLRRRQTAVAAGVVGCLALFLVAQANTTPYYSAKALVIAAPLVMAFLLRPLLEDLPGRRAIASAGGPFTRQGAQTAVSIGFVVAAMASSFLVLRGALVGPLDHADELAELRPMLQGRKTLFLGQDDYVYWELRGARISAPIAYIGDPLVPFNMRAEKPFTLYKPVDFDSFDRGNLDQFEYVVAPRAEFASVPPENWREVRSSRSYVVYQRSGPTPDRDLLDEVAGPGHVLDCDEARHRRLSQRVGEAGVRQPPVLSSEWRVTKGTPVFAEGGLVGMSNDGVAELSVRLPVGLWRVSVQYFSPEPVHLRASGPSGSFDRGPEVRLPPSEEYVGPYWDAGTVLSLGRRVTILATPERRSFPVRARPTRLGTVAFTRATPARVVPLGAACDKLVDWYRVADRPSRRPVTGGDSDGSPAAGRAGRAVRFPPGRASRARPSVVG